MALVDRMAVALQLGQFRVILKQFSDTLRGLGDIVRVDDPAEPVRQDPLADALSRGPEYKMGRPKARLPKNFDVTAIPDHSCFRLTRWMSALPRRFSSSLIGAKPAKEIAVLRRKRSFKAQISPKGPNPKLKNYLQI